MIKGAQANSFAVDPGQPECAERTCRPPRETALATSVPLSRGTYRNQKSGSGLGPQLELPSAVALSKKPPVTTVSGQTNCAFTHAFCGTLLLGFGAVHGFKSNAFPCNATST